MKKEKEVNEKHLKKIYLNVLKAIIVILYFFILNVSYDNINHENLEIGIKLLTMIFLFISIYIFEKAYKKDDGNLAIQGIEVLVLATYTLTTEHITNKFKFNFKNYSLVASYLFAIYFILKSIIIYTKGIKEKEKELSDIKEIVKESKPSKKEASKKEKEDENLTVTKTNSKKKTTSSTAGTKKKTTSSAAGTKKKTTSSAAGTKKKTTSSAAGTKKKTISSTAEAKKRVKKEVTKND